MAVGACFVAGPLAGEGLVKIQTADPACPDDSGDIYVDCGNGTVTDNRTGLVWLRDANCIGPANWQTATDFTAGLADLAGVDRDCGLTDNSSPGEWRLPTPAEFEMMVADAQGGAGRPDCGPTPPLITNDSGSACWIDGPSSILDIVIPGSYWTSHNQDILQAIEYFLDSGDTDTDRRTDENRVWPVRPGQ